MPSNIAPALDALRVPVDSITNHPGNYRQGVVSDIAASLTRFGQLKPIVVQATTDHVVAGNHTLKAARDELGWNEIAAVIVELSDEEAEAYLAADNRLSDKATNDDALLAPLLERLMLAGRLEGTGYEPDDVDDMLSSMDAMPEVEPEEFQGGNAVSDDELAERYANRSQVALRQFVLMYDQDTAEEMVATRRRLERAWGVSGMNTVVLEALRRANQDPPVEGLTVEEAERANIIPQGDPEAEVTPEHHDPGAGLPDHADVAIDGEAPAGESPELPVAPEPEDPQA